MNSFKIILPIIALTTLLGCKDISQLFETEQGSASELSEISKELEDLDSTLGDGLNGERITEEDLKFETILEKNSLFIKNGEKFKEAFYGLAGDSIRIEFMSDSPVRSISIIEERSGRGVKKFYKKNKIDFVFDVHIDNPFSISVDFIKGSYVDLKISRKSSSVDNYYNRHEIIRDSIIVNNKTPRSIKATTIGYEKVFNEPKKLIVSQLISISGKSKVYAPIEVPGNTKEFIYTLRISGKDRSISEDGKLFDKVRSSQKKIKVLGIPLWESSRTKSSLSREILNQLFPPKKDEDFSLNVFFFEKESEIKKFVNYKGDANPKAFQYDLKNSALSTQSRVGLIKKPLSGYSYIGLQTTSSFSDTYAWLDAVALYEKIFYYEIRYSIKKNE